VQKVVQKKFESCAKGCAKISINRQVEIQT